MILVSKYLVPKGYSGLTLFPFILLKERRLKTDKRFINHERIHLRQQLELLIAPFYLIYGIEFLIRLIKLKNWHLAYRAISFEREAYSNDNNLDYLKRRPFWNFIHYF
ncbi:hypothetical protein Q2T40_06040 [Winogradskyella maritima]|uniref:BlaR1 peptidase M56 n=1 Tax=Winogradskyella maritima TaxID=1517766 RepID=A0ABV8AJ50_9FLAO|nr:hypothetical protein [Winogradskyella maritima]